MDDPEHWRVIDGRRWRATDPAIPEAFRAELVDELMSARRAVGAAKRSADPGAERRARNRVQDAKVALGERGEPWWDPPSTEGTRGRIEATVRALAGHRAPDKTICPSDVARTIGGERWRDLMDPVREVVRLLVDRNEVDVEQRRRVLPSGHAWKGPIRIRLHQP